jgi:FAD binding domain
MSSSPESFTGDWITPDHPQYTEALARWAANTERRAKAVAFVKSAQDIVPVLRYATQSKLPIAIRGGGHSPSGASSIENGIVIDLSRYLSGVRVDPVAKLAYVGGGAIWETVDKAAIEHGLASVAGTVNHVSNLKSSVVQSVIDLCPCKDWCRRVRMSPLPLTSLFTALMLAFSLVEDTVS